MHQDHQERLQSCKIPRPHPQRAQEFALLTDATGESHAIAPEPQSLTIRTLVYPQQTAGLGTQLLIFQSKEVRGRGYYKVVSSNHLTSP